MTPHETQIAHIVAVLTPLDPAARLDVLVEAGRRLQALYRAPVADSPRALDNRVLAWWLDWTERHIGRRRYPDVMTSDGVTEYRVQTAADLETARADVEARIERSSYRMRQSLWYYTAADGSGVWAWRIAWCD